MSHPYKLLHMTLSWVTYCKWVATWGMADEELLPKNNYCFNGANRSHYFKYGYLKKMAMSWIENAIKYNEWYHSFDPPLSPTESKIHLQLVFLLKGEAEASWWGRELYVFSETWFSPASTGSETWNCHVVHDSNYSVVGCATPSKMVIKLWENWDK